MAKPIIRPVIYKGRLFYRLADVLFPSFRAAMCAYSCAMNAANLLPQHPGIAVEVSSISRRYRITYTGSVVELMAAGVVTEQMREKILRQRSGSMIDERGCKFRVDRGRHANKRQNKRQMWEAAERGGLD